jgi:hypothetical protein
MRAHSTRNITHIKQEAILANDATIAAESKAGQCQSTERLWNLIIGLSVANSKLILGYSPPQLAPISTSS